MFRSQPKKGEHSQAHILKNQQTSRAWISLFFPGAACSLSHCAHTFGGATGQHRGGIIWGWGVGVENQLCLEAHTDKERFEEVWVRISFLLKSLFKTLTERLKVLVTLLQFLPLLIVVPSSRSQWVPLPRADDITGLGCGPVWRWIILWVMLLRRDFPNFPTFVTFALFLLHH